MMFCAFDGPPLILRLFGVGEAHPLGSARFDELRSRFPAIPGARSIITVAIERVQTSCGYSIPFMDYRDERPTLQPVGRAQGRRRPARVLGREERREHRRPPCPRSAQGNRTVALGSRPCDRGSGCPAWSPMPRRGPTGAARLEAAGIDEISVADHLKPGRAAAADRAVGRGRRHRARDALDDGAEQRAAPPGGAGQRGGDGQRAVRAVASRSASGPGTRRTSTTPSVSRCRRRRSGSPGSRRRWSPSGACSTARRVTTTGPTPPPDRTSARRRPRRTHGAAARRRRAPGRAAGRGAPRRHPRAHRVLPRRRAPPKLTHFSDDGARRAAGVSCAGLPRDRDEPLRFQALVQLLRVTDDRQAAAEALVAEWGDALPLTLDEVLTTPFLLLGTAAEIAEQLHERIGSARHRDVDRVHGATDRPRPRRSSRRWPRPFDR